MLVSLQLTLSEHGQTVVFSQARRPGPALLAAGRGARRQEVRPLRRLRRRGQAERDLAADRGVLREQLGALTEEVRLLREALYGSGVAGPAAEAPAVMQGAPRTRASPAAGARDQPLPGAPPAVAAPPAAGGVSAGAAPASQAAAGGTSRVKVVSAGNEAGDIADFFVDDLPLPMSGPEGRRGLNVVVIDPGSGQVLTAKSYDIWGDPSAQNKRLASDIGCLPDGHVVLVALKDSGGENLSLDALEALESVGALLDERLGFREGYALIGQKGGKRLAERRGGRDRPTLVEASLPFAVRLRGPR